MVFESKKLRLSQEFIFSQKHDQTIKFMNCPHKAGASENENCLILKAISEENEIMLPGDASYSTYTSFKEDFEYLNKTFGCDVIIKRKVISSEMIEIHYRDVKYFIN